MKKSLIVGILVAAAAFAAASFAAANAPAAHPPQAGQGMMMDAAQMQAMHASMSDQMVKSGMMTAEQAKAMSERMAQGGAMPCAGGQAKQQ